MAVRATAAPNTRMPTRPTLGMVRSTTFPNTGHVANMTWTASKARCGANPRELELLLLPTNAHKKDRANPDHKDVRTDFQQISRVMNPKISRAGFRVSV